MAEEPHFDATTMAPGGISQECLAERADLHRTYITDIERGARNLSLETMSRLAGALGLTIGAFFSRMEAGNGLAQHPDPGGKPVDVLLVEDDAEDIELTLDAFKSAGLTNRVLVVHDGEAALDFVFCRRQFANRLTENTPQLLLLDLNLPKVSGLEVLRRIKADERTRHLRVVILTGSQKNEHIHKALELGAETYIVKPVDFHNFSEVTPKLSMRWALLAPNAQTPRVRASA